MFVYLRVISKVKSKYKPDAIVCQCGVDTLAGDPMASFNLTQFGVGHCVKNLLSWNLPTMILGGGKITTLGYKLLIALAYCCNVAVTNVYGRTLEGIIELPE